MPALKSYPVFRNRVPIGTIEGLSLPDAQERAFLLWDAGVKAWDDGDTKEGLEPYLAYAARKRQSVVDMEARLDAEDYQDDRYIQRLWNGFLGREWQQDDDCGDQPT